MPDLAEISALADRIRLRALRMVEPLQFGYLGQALSAAELYASVYGGPLRPAHDDVVVSPGHYIVCAYAAAAELGMLDAAGLDTYGQDDSEFEAIGTDRSQGVSLSCGSLGQGLTGAAGFALSNRLRGKTDARTFAFLSDGEMEEGQVWEAAMFAAHWRLTNLVAVLDANDSQVDGPVSSITTVEPLPEKWRAFGWDVYEVDGHNVGAIATALDQAIASDRPAIVIGRTSTRHGLDAILPDDADGHFIKLPPAMALAAHEELEARLA
ncbi:MAG: hypothetical protein LBK59_05875 [Bifidobacteriaceae bacterium]|jgi:transketolase|nr:hypothetical protein [Bifidobacteriaceae bacterium]